MGGDYAQTVLESHHTRWPSLSISVCIAGSQERRSRTRSTMQHESGKDFCLGYISGVADHMLLNGAFLRSHGKGFKEEDRDLLTDLSACLTTTGSFEGVVQTFITWFEKHPNERNLTMHLGVVEALSEIWPCD
jgi:Rap1a immunity proteins